MNGCARTPCQGGALTYRDTLLQRLFEYPEMDRQRTWRYLNLEFISVGVFEAPIATSSGSHYQ